MTLFDILKLGGGLAFFLYGMNMMSQSLTKLAGSRMEEILRRMTGSPLRGLILGIVVTGVVPSPLAARSCTWSRSCWWGWSTPG